MAMTIQEVKGNARRAEKCKKAFFPERRQAIPLDQEASHFCRLMR